MEGGGGGEKRKEEVSFSPLPSPVIYCFFLLSSQLSRRTLAKTQATQASDAKRSISTVLRKNRGLWTVYNYYYYLNTFSFPFRIKFVNSKALYNKFNDLTCTKQENRKGSGSSGSGSQNTSSHISLIFRSSVRSVGQSYQLNKSSLLTLQAIFLYLKPAYKLIFLAIMFASFALFIKNCHTVNDDLAVFNLSDLSHCEKTGKTSNYRHTYTDWKAW